MDGVFSQRDATVAATIIQWLGSPVGSSFVESVQKKHKELPDDPFLHAPVPTRGSRFEMEPKKK